MVLSMRIVPALLALPLLAAAPAERGYSVTDFDRLRVDGPFEVVLVTGRAPSARASGGKASDLDGLLVEVAERELKVRAKPGRNPDGIRVEVSTHALRSASVSGPAQVSIDRIRTQRAALSLSGSGGIIVDQVEADMLTLGAAGSGRIQIGGSAKTLKAAVAGTAELDGDSLMADQAEVTSQTAGRITVGARTTATVSASGSGETIVTGTAACTVEQRGRGPVRCGR